MDVPGTVISYVSDKNVVCTSDLGNIEMLPWMVTLVNSESGCLEGPPAKFGTALGNKAIVRRLPVVVDFLAGLFDPAHHPAGKRHDLKHIRCEQ